MCYRKATAPSHTSLVKKRAEIDCKGGDEGGMAAYIKAKRSSSDEVIMETLWMRWHQLTEIRVAGEIFHVQQLFSLALSHPPPKKVGPGIVVQDCGVPSGNPGPIHTSF